MSLCAVESTNSSPVDNLRLTPRRPTSVTMVLNRACLSLRCSVKWSTGLSNLSARRVSTSAVRKPIVWTHLPGPVPYSQALQLQEGMVSSRLKAKDALVNNAESMSAQERQSYILLAETDVVLFLEHAPVYTSGRREQDQAALDDQAKRLTEATGASFVSTQRGGLTTFHGPGQLMCYPILDLDAMDVRFVFMSHSDLADTLTVTCSCQRETMFTNSKLAFAPLCPLSVLPWRRWIQLKTASGCSPTSLRRLPASACTSSDG